MLGLVKEKSWSVRLAGGYLLNGVVRADLCKDCEASTTIVARNNSNPNLLLFGCNGTKCKHRLIRFNFTQEEDSESIEADKPEDFQFNQSSSTSIKDNSVFT